MNQEISFNNLPAAIQKLLEKVNWIENFLLEGENRSSHCGGNKEILTAKETAQYLNITLPTLHNWVKNGKLPVGFRAEEVEKLLFKVESRKN
ncbi:MAG: helix-turn-helix domain-containing protein [Saprospiraceae bacterium]|nr:helix-turn-helix domain-containing protein [Saprospiraceae bacterium]